MERVTIDVGVRGKVGKETAKKVRKEGNIPGIVYGKETNIPIIIPFVSIKALKALHFSESIIINMNVSGEKKNDQFATLIKDIQLNPLTEAIIHIDFLKIALDKKTRVNVSVVVQGEAAGVKAGGVLEQILREIEIEALPLFIPEHIEVDVSGLEIGDSLHVSNIKAGEGIKILTNSGETIATVVGMKAEELPEAKEVIPGEQPAVPVEPEVIKKKEKPEKPEKTSE